MIKPRNWAECHKNYLRRIIAVFIHLAYHRNQQLGQGWTIFSGSVFLGVWLYSDSLEGQELILYFYSWFYSCFYTHSSHLSVLRAEFFSCVTPQRVEWAWVFWSVNCLLSARDKKLVLECELSSPNTLWSSTHTF